MRTIKQIQSEIDGTRHFMRINTLNSKFDEETERLFKQKLSFLEDELLSVFEITAELRWLLVDDPEDDGIPPIYILQQKWVNVEGKIEWREVPKV